MFKLIKDISGGERGRVSLAKLMLSDANFLILDEPTNHLDIISKEILENAIANYTGTVLYVSHDRYFINRTATRILDLKNQKLLNYIGNYDYYLEKKPEVERMVFGYALSEESMNHGKDSKNNVLSGLRVQQGSAASSSAPSPSNESETKLDWKQQKEEQARLRKRQNDLKRVEDAIQKAEARDEELNALLMDETIYSSPSKLMELNKEKAELEERLTELMSQWEELVE